MKYRTVKLPEPAYADVKAIQALLLERVTRRYPQYEWLAVGIRGMTFGDIVRLGVARLREELQGAPSE